MRIGKIKITDTVISDAIKDNKYLSVESLKILFTRVIPVHIENRSLQYRDYIYTCISEEFGEVEEGCEIPFYGVTFIKDGDVVKIKSISR